MKTLTPLECVAKKRAEYGVDTKPSTIIRKSRGKWYAEYLQSPAWKQIVNLVHKRVKNVCEGCGFRKSTQVHHLTYDHVGHEFLFELVALCDTCHARFHDKPAKTTLPRSRPRSA